MTSDQAPMRFCFHTITSMQLPMNWLSMHSIFLPGQSKN